MSFRYCYAMNDTIRKYLVQGTMQDPDEDNTTHPLVVRSSPAKSSFGITLTTELYFLVMGDILIGVIQNNV